MVLYLSLTIGVPSSESQPEPQPSEQSAESSKSSKTPQSQIVTSQKDAVKSDSQPMLDSGETAHVELEYPMRKSSDQPPPPSRKQLQLTSEVC